MSGFTRAKFFRDSCYDGGLDSGGAKGDLPVGYIGSFF
jgi:hypothetical protein